MANQELYKRLERLHLRTQYVRITLLDFHDLPIKELQGVIKSGSVSVNGSSAVRRTISLSMLAPLSSDIEDLDNDISLHKKVKVEVGYDNPFYQEMNEKIIWFKCGIFVLTSASTSRNTSGFTITITGKDKMCMLDGTCGGVIPAALVASEKEIEHADGTRTILYPTIFEIITEAVSHYGGETAEKIIISDVDEEIRQVMQYRGLDPIYFVYGQGQNYAGISFTEPSEEVNYTTIQPGDDAGYEFTPFIYPGDLNLNPGDTVVTLLDKIKNTLGNFEYFYDIDGNFVFQKIKNYLDDGSPLLEKVEENGTYVSAQSSKNYVKNYSNTKFLYNLTDLDTTTQINKSPKWADIKNDFYVWGETSEKQPIRYHLAIDTKPTLDLAIKYMWKVVNGEEITYKFTNTEAEKEEGWEKIGSPSLEWREELYRRALIAQTTNSVYDNYYDSEMIAEWRNLYTAESEWNPDVYRNPKSIRFWIDFIDDSSPLGKYSISNIGRRTKIVSNNECRSVYNKAVPEVIFVSPENKQKQNDLTNSHYNWMQLNEQTQMLFDKSSTGVSCFDQIRELLYQNLNYNTTIQITCLPKYYMEPNNVIYIHDEAMGVDGNYLVTQFTLPLAYNGTMSITATEVVNRV